MGSTLDRILGTAPVQFKPGWVTEPGVFSALWEPERGELAARAVAQRIDEVAIERNVVVTEIARVTSPQSPRHEGIYCKTEPQT